MKMQYAYILLVFIGIAACDKSNNTKVTVDPVSAPTQIGVEKVDSIFVQDFLEDYPQYKFYKDRIHKFYSRRGYRLAWTELGVPIPHASLFINVVENIREYGILSDSSSIYNVGDTLALLQQSNQKSSAPLVALRKSFDVALTSLYFSYLPKLWSGVIDPQSDDSIEWYVAPKKITYAGMLDSILNTSEQQNAFIDFRRFHPEFLKLKDILKHYLKIEKEGGWTSVISDSILSMGDSGIVIHNLSERLFSSGDLSRQFISSKFDMQLEEAIKIFQARHGLEVDGIVGTETRQALNVSIRERIKQIVINMERWRWVPARMTNNYIYVNIPEFQLYAYQNNRVVKKMKVIVGRSGSHTVVFNDEIKYIVVNPYWNIPKNIAVEEILPNIKEDRDYLVKHNIEVGKNWKFGDIRMDSLSWEDISVNNFNYTFRQRPGPDNPLGQLKFIFPNEFSIYLHDTPIKRLFGEQERVFSHGCIRVAQPLVLAEYLLKNNSDYTIPKLKSLLERKKDFWIELEEPIPVYILYFTVWIDENGRVQFRKDIYDHDRIISEKLFTN